MRHRALRQDRKQPEEAMPLSLSSPAFRNGERIPAKYTGDGENLSPPLAWSGAPPGTRSFALIVEDPDAPSGTFRHWGIYNLPGDRSMMPEGVERGAQAEPMSPAVNDFNHPGYDGPAPPKGHGTHHYHFRLAALDVERLAQPTDIPVADLWREVQSHKLAEAELVGTYAR